MSHTKGPWVAKETIDGWNIYSGRMPVPVWNIEIAKAEFAKDEEEAKHIVRCVNSHDDLLVACELAKNELGDLMRHGREGERAQAKYARETLTAAIAKAEKGES